jgi:hypothetical protein
LAAIGVVAFWPGEKEPEYKGKKLSEWLNVVATNLSIEDVTAFEEHHFAEIKSAASLEGIGAVRSIGTNAVPWFVKWVERDRPAWRTKA